MRADDEFDKQVLDAELVTGFIHHAIETHNEAAQLKTILDLDGKPALSEADDGERIELYLFHESQPEPLLIADIPVADLMPSQN